MSKYEEYQAKVQNYYKLYTDATLRIASNPQEWLKFIRTSCKNYKCDFRELIMVNATRPDATAVLPMKEWNKKFGRWINKNSVSIPVLDFKADKFKIKYYFDISDTHETPHAKPVPLWEHKQEYNSAVISALNSEFSLRTSSLESAIMFSVRKVVEDRFELYLKDFLNRGRKNSSLTKLAVNNVSKLYRDMLVSTATYIVLSRCGIDASAYLKSEDFGIIEKFDTVDSIVSLGTASSAVAKSVLQVISKTIFKEQVKEKDYGTHLQTGRTLYDTERRASTGGAGSGTEQVRQNEENLSAQRTSDYFRQYADTGRTEPTPYGSQQTSSGENGYISRADEGRTGSDRGAESERPNEMGGYDEQHYPLSGGDSSQRIGIHRLSDTEQLNNIEEMQAEEDFKTSAFLISQEEIDYALQYGSSFEDGKYRIFQQFEKNATLEENAAFLKKEYGLGGGVHPLINSIDFNFNPKGIFLEKNDTKIKLNWKRVAKRIKELIALDRYLNENEKKGYIEYSKKHNVDNLSTLSQTSTEEKRYILQYKATDTCFIGADKYVISNIDYKNNTVLLDDERFPLLNKTMSIDEFNSKLTENQSNEHLRVAVSADFKELSMDTFIDVASDRLADYSSVRSAHDDLSEREYLEEIENSLDNFITDLRTGGEEISGYTRNEIEIFLKRMDTDTDLKQYVLDVVSENADISLTTLESVRDIAKSEELPFSDKFSKGVDDDFDPYIFDGSMSADDYEDMHDHIEQDAESDEKSVAEFPEFFEELDNENTLSEYFNQSDNLGNTLIKQFASDEIIDIAYALGITNSSLNKEEHLRDTYENVAKRELCSLNHIVYIPDFESEIKLTTDDTGVTFSLADTTYSRSWQDVGQSLYSAVSNYVLKNMYREIIVEAVNSKAYVSSFSDNQNAIKKSVLQINDARKKDISKQYVSFDKNDKKFKLFGNVGDANEVILKAFDNSSDLIDYLKENQYVLDGYGINAEAVFNVTKSADELQVGDVVRFENEEWTISKIDGDFSAEFINNDKSSKLPVQKLIGHWKENLSEIGFEYIKSSQSKIEENKSDTVVKSKPLKLTNREKEPIKKENYHISDDNIGVGKKSERISNNIAAIRTLKAIESEGRMATAVEKEILSNYVGWGGLPDVFDEKHSAYNELKSLLSSEEYSSARESTLTAFYTPPVVIKSIYNVLENLGFERGNILEPSCGTGNFIGLLPENMQDSKFYGVELDSISGRIATQLYQKSNIAVQGYENTKLPDSFFDVAVGNVPFGQFKVADKRYDKNNFLIHDYFFAKTLDKVRPGGVIAFITSRGTMDKKSENVRKYIAQRAELLGAIRLPNNTFKSAAGTEVTSDIIFLQKRERVVDIEPEWVQLSTDENGLTYNSYFVNHPEMVIGDIKEVSGPYGPEIACISKEEATLEDLLNAAVKNIKGEIETVLIDEETGEIEDTIPAAPDVRNYSYTLVDGHLYFRENSFMKKVQTSETATERIKGMIELRDCTRDLIE